MLTTPAIQVFTEADAQRVLREYPACPGSDGKILYLPDDPAIVVPMVRGAWIHAAIIPASNELKAELDDPKKYSTT